jgi:AraC-like DNA-binding protein
MYDKCFSFEYIHPFVRYAHISELKFEKKLFTMKAYDHRLFYIYNGKGIISINNKNRIVQKGDLFFLQSDTPYSINRNSNSSLTIIGINFDFTYNHQQENSYPVPPDRVETFTYNKIIEKVKFTDAEVFNKPFYLKSFEIIESSLINIKNEYTIRKKYYVPKLSGMLASTLTDIFRLTLSDNTNSSINNDLIDLLIKYIHDNFHTPISNKEIGAHFNFHPNYLNRLVVEHTGMSLHQYIINYRISQSINLINTTDKSISVIAYSVGFNDLNHFSKCFKSKVGVSPKKFKFSRYIHSL